MFSRRTLLAAFLALTSFASACPEHDFHSPHHYKKRAETGGIAWAYDSSYDWGRLSHDFELCQAGTQQAPIPLLLTQGLSSRHVPTFNDNYEGAANGTFFNWGYGPAMSLAHEQGVYTTLPSFTFEEGGQNETVFLTGWHIHSPADHSVQGDRSKAELHMVHVDGSGKPRAVLAFRIDPGNSDSPLFHRLPEFFSFRDPGKNATISMDPSVALNEVGGFSEFWTYRGSLTSPPCTEGIRFFVARNILFVGHGQMQDILRVSTYSARAEQEVWLHQINV